MTLKEIVLGTLFTLGIGLGIDVEGHIKPSNNNIPGKNANLKMFVMRSPPGTTDTLFQNIDRLGQYVCWTENFNPGISSGDTIHIYAYKDTLGKHFEARTKWKLLYDNNSIYEICLDNPDKPGTAYTLNVKNFSDTLQTTRMLDAKAIS